MTSQNQIKLTNIIAPSFYNLYWDIKEKRYTRFKLGGGRGSTKSTFSGTMIIHGMMEDAEKGNITNAVIFRRYKNDLKDSVYGQLVWAIEILGVSHLWRMTESPLRLKYEPTGQVILFRGADKVTKAKSIKVPKGYIKYLWFEELDEFEGPEKIRSIEQSVVRGGEDFQEFLTFNPPPSPRNWVNDPSHWSANNTLEHKSTYLDVPPEWLGHTFIESAEHLKETNLTAYEHEYLGEVVGTGTEVFDNLVLREITDAEISAFDRLYFGVDWGWYPDPWAYNKVYYNAQSKMLYVLDEDRRNKTKNQETARILVQEHGVKPSNKIICDSAEKKSVADYKSYKINAREAVKGPGSVEYSMKWLQSLNGIVIDQKRTPHTAKEFIFYEKDRDKNGDVLNGYPDRNNHHIDAIRYALEEIWRRKGQ